MQSSLFNKEETERLSISLKKQLAELTNQLEVIDAEEIKG